MESSIEKQPMAKLLTYSSCHKQKQQQKQTRKQKQRQRH